MRFILMMSTPKDGYAQYLRWPPEALQANIAFMQEFARKLRASGELVSTAGLASPQQARRVRSGADGKPVTDGVFPESKEFLAGFWLVDVESAERADAIAAELSEAPGGAVVAADGTPIEHLWVEVRELLGSHQDLDSHQERA